MADRNPVLLAWMLGDYFGWGIAGLNIFSHWSLRERLRPIMARTIEPEHVAGLDPQRRIALSPHFLASNAALAELSRHDPSTNIKISAPVVHALGNRFGCAVSNHIHGRCNVGRMVFEDTDLSVGKSLEGRYDCYVTASCWGRDLLSSVTDTPVFLIPEGVDLSYFHPAPPSGLFSEELFLVFSGGKVEFRKGQDIVLKAFKAFSEGKSNVRLVTAWQTNFKGVGSGFQGLLDAPLTEGERGLDVRRWGADNGINPELIVNLGALRQADVALILREMDCAVQVSRCEGGTNFVAMEAMASGVPTILSAVAGHLDIVDYPNAMPVRPGPSVVAIEGCGTDGWGEARVDDVAHELEKLYVQKITSGRPVRRPDLFPRTWAQHADELAALLRRIDPSLP